MSRQGVVRRVVLAAGPGADIDTLQAVTEFEGFNVQRASTPAELDALLRRLVPEDTRLVVDDSQVDGAGREFLAILHKHPQWLEAPVIYMADPGRPPPPEPGVMLKKPVTGPVLAKTLRALGEINPAESQSGVAMIERFGDYELLAKIASGGMGTVYLAQRRNQVGFHRLHALKVMHPHLVEDPEVSASFLDEASVASRVHHGNVAAIVDLGAEKGRPFIVMQYVEGCSLSTLIRAKRGPSPPTLVGSIMIGVLDGLHAAHTLIDDDGAPMSIVHRDVSPDNILVGIDGIARIADFGIAKARNRVSTTEQGIRKGKLLYLSPEQLQDQELDPRVDVYAAGVVLWNALTGRRLFAGDSPAHVLSNIVSAKIPPPSAVDDAIPTALDTVCLRALARDRDERYSSAAEMAQALRRAMVDLGASVSPLDVGAWVRSVCGDELEARRVLARRRRRSAGLPTTSLPLVPPAAQTAEPDRTLLSVTEFATPTSKEGSWTPYHASTQHRIVRDPEPARRRVPVWLPFVLVGGASVAVGALFSAQCGRGAEEPEAVVAKAAVVPEQPANTEPTPREAEVVKPAEERPPAAEASHDVVSTKSERSEPSPRSPQPPATTVQPTDAEPALPPEPADVPTRRARRRRNVKKPEAQRKPAAVSSEPPTTEPKPKPKPKAPDPLSDGPDRNPYK